MSKNELRSSGKPVSYTHLMFVISVLAIIIQMLLTVDIRLVLGETATALVGGIPVSYTHLPNELITMPDKPVPTNTAILVQDTLTLTPLS